ncbi:UDP-N-acetylmuramate dehydrogenase [Clostridium transplantifaecale]|uniref:UDP-N-acetylmuramate dehydrogenase n=1 Tax=Clostridium transplantifaecale TaxID=2479838 RepID=UPI000F63C82B|nr:UDP-N-acetylmuramate dehydrogenase [Clostridium transplantifaecale]
MNNFFERLCLAAGDGQVKKDEMMSGHTTFRVGGPASYFVSPDGDEALRNVLLLCQEEQMPYYILGNGSNLLVSDKGYDGVMILMGESFSGIREDEPCEITAGAGALLSRIAKEAMERSLTGFEFAAGIPGTLGGAAVMNAGAYDGEMKDVLKSVRVMDKSGRILTLTRDELDLGYRHSCIPEREYTVLSAVISLKKGDREKIQEKMAELAKKRRDKQPLEYPSAGSTFKRPAGYFAGKLIDDAGMRGYREGGAQVSEKHCGFVINCGGATAEDIRSLCRSVQRKVKETSGVDLETEVRMIGWD